MEFARARCLGPELFFRATMRADGVGNHSRVKSQRKAFKSNCAESSAPAGGVTTTVAVSEAKESAGNSSWTEAPVKLHEPY